ncbi:glycosyltransferase family 4 protein [Planctomicrobium piriforme]|uniref:Glycosyltransferase involved in cell wall bisynthesis n=1 Tax=Planctomicrobium piriforme TaxID=1576369 RepID=A0A1I3EMF0_9PLAN|nr:glycosyltransferase family 4 protein [Planctomicrobium piriforme]SFI00033.1 Glycosyltransferase involved in cell wall bisynthesis [Planctomicrobium piriforme]
MHIAIVTAGGAGMFCGSCMHDNTWARALIAQGAEVSLIPCYTPLRLDEQSASLNRVFFGGINVYLNGKLGWWKSMPRAVTGWLDNPSLIRWATSFSVSNDAAELGELMLSMLQGEHGPHRTAVAELADFLRQLRPDVIIFSNALLSGALHEIRQATTAPVLCTLQGDDVFLDSLTPAYRQRSIDLVSKCSQEFDGFLTHTEFYRQYMANYLSLPVDAFSVLPLGIDVNEYPGRPRPAEPGRFVVGYFARMAPEKGLHHLADAFVLLKQRLPYARLKIGGYQEGPGREYLNKVLAHLSAQGIEVENAGSPSTIAEKIRFFSDLDVFSVPTDFLEPKGMSILEAMANGVPVVQPAHGSFPEIIQATGGGLLVTPKNPQALADGLEEMSDPARRARFAHDAWENVRAQYNPQRMAERTLEILQRTSRRTLPVN